MPDWLTETLDSGYGQRLTIDQSIYAETSAFQEILIFENRHFGRVLVLDGAVQTTELDEAAYHEMLVHVPIFAHPSPQQVLIIGGGDGGTAREVLRHPVTSVTMVEIDGQVVQACARHLPSLSDGAFDDPRLTLHIADGLAFVAEQQASYDIIIIDGTDPVGAGEVLFTERFFADCKQRLAPGGILVSQAGIPLLNRDAFMGGFRRLARIFPDASAFLTPVATYSGGPLAIGYSLGEAAPWDTARQQRYDAMASKLKHFTPSLYEAAFALPHWLESELSASR